MKTEYDNAVNPQIVCSEQIVCVCVRACVRACVCGIMYVHLRRQKLLRKRLRKVVLTTHQLVHWRRSWMKILW